MSNVDVLIVDDDSERPGPARQPRKMRGPSLAERLADNAAGDPMGPRQTLAVSNAALRLTLPAEANSATIAVETATVRYTVDGTTPTTTVGTLVAVGDMIKVQGRQSLIGLQLIRATGADATVQVEYFN